MGYMKILAAALIALACVAVPMETFAYRAPSGTVIRPSRRAVRQQQRRSASFKRSVPRRASSSSRSSVRASSSSSLRSTVDPDHDLSVRSDIVLLGETTPVLGAVDFFAAQEPIDVRTINIRFFGNPASIQQVRVYAERDGRLLGTSMREPSGDYEIPVAEGALRLPHRAEEGVYVRALMKPADGGASGGQIVQIEHIEAEGDGVWSDGEYTVATTQTFLSFETAPAAITGFAPATSFASSAFVVGPSVTLWDYLVSGRTTDGDFEPAITSLTFRLAASSNVTLSGVRLTVPGTGAESDCTAGSGIITCAGIPKGVGAIDGTQRIRLIADVALSPAQGDPFLQVTLQSGGSPANPGDIVWTDGATTYDWLGIDEPIARGVRYQ